VSVVFEQILVLKLGALGDFVQAVGPMMAIRSHHNDAHIVLLTTAAYVDFAKALNLFDDIWVDADRPKSWQIGKVLALRKKLRCGNFTRVYDLQTSERSGSYFQIMRPEPRPEWSGIAWGCSHPHTNLWRDNLHTCERQNEQLAAAGITNVAVADFSGVKSNVARFGLRSPYAVLVPGGAAHRPEKRWPEARYAKLANHMLAEGLTPVLVGAGAELELLQAIANAAPGAVNLGGKTDFMDIASLAHGANVAVGNDTGPMHLIAAANCPSVVLYSYDSDPELCAQRGKAVRILRHKSLRTLHEVEVWSAVNRFIK